ncbi:MAG: hypothetical protein HY720_18660 [Planctomycetes bacterium]|nr:hypothetical protein [Planctomycetota bacterium]
MKWTFAALAGALLAFSTGCIDMDETIALNEDGSGTITVIYTIPYEVMKADEKYADLTEEKFLEKAREEAKADLDGMKIEGFTVDDLTIEKVDEEFLQFTISASFENLAVLSKLEVKSAPGMGGGPGPGDGEDKKEQPGILARDATLEEVDGQFVFTQKIRLDKKDKKEEDPMSKQIGGLVKGAFAGHKMTFTVVLPKAIESAEGAISTEGESATWQYRMAEVMDLEEIGPMEAKTVK